MHSKSPCAGIEPQEQLRNQRTLRAGWRFSLGRLLEEGSRRVVCVCVCDTPLLPKGTPPSLSLPFPCAVLRLPKKKKRKKKKEKRKKEKPSKGSKATKRTRPREGGGRSRPPSNLPLAELSRTRDAPCRHRLTYFNFLPLGLHGQSNPNVGGVFFLLPARI